MVDFRCWRLSFVCNWPVNKFSVSLPFGLAVVVEPRYTNRTRPFASLWLWDACSSLACSVRGLCLCLSPCSGRLCTLDGCYCLSFSIRDFILVSDAIWSAYGNTFFLLRSPRRPDKASEEASTARVPLKFVPPEICHLMPRQSATCHARYSSCITESF